MTSKQHWELTIGVASSSREGLIKSAQTKLHEIMPILMAGKLPVPGFNALGTESWVIQVKNPVRNRIAELRAEADRLEAEANKMQEPSLADSTLGVEPYHLPHSEKGSPR